MGKKSPLNFGSHSASASESSRIGHPHCLTSQSSQSTLEWPNPRQIAIVMWYNTFKIGRNQTFGTSRNFIFSACLCCFIIIFSRSVSITPRNLKINLCRETRMPVIEQSCKIAFNRWNGIASYWNKKLPSLFIYLFITPQRQHTLHYKHTK